MLLSWRMSRSDIRSLLSSSLLKNVVDLKEKFSLSTFHTRLNKRSRRMSFVLSRFVKLMGKLSCCLTYIMLECIHCLYNLKSDCPIVDVLYHRPSSSAIKNDILMQIICNIQRLFGFLYFLSCKFFYSVIMNDISFNTFCQYKCKNPYNKSIFGRQTHLKYTVQRMR